MASIQNMLPDDCRVIRNGNEQTVRSSEIVPGDLLKIGVGDKLSADMRFVVVSSDVKFDRSLLTGKYTLGLYDSNDTNLLKVRRIPFVELSIRPTRIFWRLCLLD
jgi:sodium/potassium-transporting ATPase subunit alpha